MFEGRNSTVQNSCKYLPCRYVGRFLLARSWQLTCSLITTQCVHSVEEKYCADKVTLLALTITATLLIAPAAWADTISENVFLGSTQIGTLTIVQGGSGSCMSFSSTSVCVDIETTGGTTVRLGGPVVGFSGDVNENGLATDVSNVSFGSLSLGACGGVGKQTVCLDAKGSLTTNSLIFVLTNADTTTGITVGNVHVASDLCSTGSTCFATTTPTTMLFLSPARWR